MGLELDPGDGQDNRSVERRKMSILEGKTKRDGERNGQGQKTVKHSGDRLLENCGK